jgi:NADH-quinone oxidoreductase subunit J
MQQAQHAEIKDGMEEDPPMTLYSAIFYCFAALTLAATALAVTRRQPVHAVIFLIQAFLGTAALFFLLGAPLLAAFEVIIYAGAIMVLFVFIIMMLELGPLETQWSSLRLVWAPGLILGGAAAVIAATLLVLGAFAGAPLEPALASPGDFGRFLFHHYWLSVEIASFLLLVALVGALFLGRRQGQSEEEPDKEGS